MHFLVLDVSLEAVCDGVRDGPPADPNRVPLCVVLWGVCPYHDILGEGGTRRDLPSVNKYDCYRNYTRILFQFVKDKCYRMLKALLEEGTSKMGRLID